MTAALSSSIVTALPTVISDAQRRLLILRRGEVIVNVGADEHRAHARPWVQTRDGGAQSPRFRWRDDGTLLTVRRSGAFPAPVRPSGCQQVAAKCPPPISAVHQVAPVSTGTMARSAEHGDQHAICALGIFSRYRPGVLRCAEEGRPSGFGTIQLADNDQVLTLVAQSLHLRVDYRRVIG